MDEQPVCRLCGGDVKRVFNGQVLAKYNVGYEQCQRCGSLQTEPPYWLGEAYGQNLSSLDTGAGQRVLDNFAAVHVLARVLGLRNLLDFGGGDGLMCRLLRDHGFNAFATDKHAKGGYAQGFGDPDFASPDLLTSFEVFEHMAAPALEIDELFTLRPKVLMLTTQMYSDQGPDWWYLAKESGQHVFFYSREAMKLIAEKYGYELRFIGGFIVFALPGLISFAKRQLLQRLMQGRLLRLMRARLAYLQPEGFLKDHEAMRERQR
jgi:hypothetical protein